MSRDLLICLGLFTLVLLLFAPARRYELINFDDAVFVQDPHVQRGLTADGLRWAMTTPVLANWHPLTLLSFMLDAQLFGPANPAANHFVNVVLHALNAMLLYAALRYMTGATWRSASVALLWAVHPLRVESVAWVAERKDLLCAFFFLLTILAYTRYARTGFVAAYVTTLVLFILGLMSKPMIVTLPAVLLLLDFFPLNRPARWTRFVLEKVPMLVLAGGMCLATVLTQRRAGAMSDDVYPIALRLGNGIWAYARYLSQAFVPTKLAVFYPYYGALPGTKLPLSGMAIGVACVIAITAVAVVFWRRGERAALVGWLWFLGTLVPVIGLVQVGWQSIADRYTYIPHMGLFLAIVWSIASFLPDRPTVRRAAFACVVVVALALSIMTARQLTYWRNSIALFSHALGVTDLNHVAHACLGNALEEAGDYAGAMAHFQEQYRIKPSQPQALYNIGCVLSKQGRYAEAQAYYQRALAIDPNYADAMLNLAHALSQKGQHAQAAERYRRGLELKPDAAQARLYFALELRELGREGEAREQLMIAREVARAQNFAGMVREIDAQLSRRPATTQQAGDESKSSALPKPPGTLENPSH